MKTKEHDERPADQSQQDGRRFDSLIGRRVLDALSQPGDTCRTQVRRLWEGHYRVNVLSGTDPTATRIVGSYFLVVDGEGNILASTPSITRRA